MKFTNIQYRNDRKMYQVTIRRNGAFYCEYFERLTDALEYRRQMYKKLGLKLPNSIQQKNKDNKKQKIPTFAEAYLTYMEHIQALRQLTPSTVYTYKRCFDALLPFLRKAKITDITPEKWNDLFFYLQNHNNWSQRYTKRMIGRVRAMYQYYMDKYPHITKKLKDNPITPTDIIQTKKKQQPVFTDKEKEIFLNMAKSLYGVRWYMLFLLYFQTGCRKGELLALQWENVCFEEGNYSIYIDKSISKGWKENVYTEYVGTTKTPSSVRRIPISPKMGLMLYSLKKTTNSKPNGFVFRSLCVTAGKYPFLSLSRVTDIFQRIRKQCNINQDLHIHSIRHYFATKLITNGADIKTVMALGGWSRSSTLLEIYTHATENSKLNALKNTIF